MQQPPCKATVPRSCALTRPLHRSSLPSYEADGLLVVGPDARGTQVVQAVGPWARAACQLRPGGGSTCQAA